MSGPVEVTCDLGVVKVIPFGSEQVQLRMRLGLRGGAPIETVLLLTRTQAKQIADGLVSGDLVELIDAGRSHVMASLPVVRDVTRERLSQALGRFR